MSKRIQAILIAVIVIAFTACVPKTVIVERDPIATFEATYLGGDVYRIVDEEYGKLCYSNTHDLVCFELPQ